MQEIDHSANPFPGLRPFESSETHLFFGRDGQSEELLRRLKRTRFLAVVGTSGSGKSSLVRAGLLPALQGGLMASAGSDWRIAILRPGGDPIGNLARALAAPAVLGARDEKGADMQAVMAETTLRRSSLGLVELVSRARAKLDDSGRPLVHDYENLLVVVDQFEELFRFKQLIEEGNSQEDAAAFVKVLLEAVGQKDEQKIYVVLTMRSDFLGDCSQFFELPEAINNGQYLIPRMTRDERREAISGPVSVGQGAISEPLVNQLLNDVGDNPDQLPIMQHALMRTWDHWLTHRNGNPIDIPDYHAIGGMAEALSRHADEAYAELNDAQKAIAEKLFKGLTEKGTDNREIRRPMEVREICELTGADEAAVIAVIDVFRREGRSFLMPPPTDALTGAPVHLNRESLIDISHESLIRNWERLKKWTEEEAQSARIYKRLAETAMLHHAGEEALLMDPALQGALDWREKNKPNAVWARRYHPEFDTSMRYLDASVAARDAEVKEREKRRRQEVSHKRTKIAAVLLALSFLLSLGSAAYAIQQSREAKRQRQIADTQRNIAESKTDVARKESLEASIQKAEALKQKKIADARSNDAERNRKAALEQKQKAEVAKGQAVQAARMATEQAALAHASERRASEAQARAERLQAEATTQALKNRQLFYWADINLAQQSYEVGDIQRGRELLSDHASAKGDSPGFEWFYLWHLLYGEKELKAPDEKHFAFALAGDGKTVATSTQRTVELRDLAHSKTTVFTVADPKDGTYIHDVTLSPDGKLLAVALGRSIKNFQQVVIKLYDVTSQKELGTFNQMGSNVFPFAFSPDGRRLIVGLDEDIKLFDVSPFRETGNIKTPKVTGYALSPDGKMLATSTSDQDRLIIKLSELVSGQEVGELKGKGAIVRAIAFSPKGEMLATGGGDKKVLVWSIKSRQPIDEYTFYAGSITALSYSPDGSKLAIGYEDGTIQLCNPTDQTEYARLTRDEGSILFLAFSPDSKILFSFGGGNDPNVRSWDVAARTNQQMPSDGYPLDTKAITFSPDGKVIAIKREYQRVTLLDANTNKELYTLSEVDGIAFSPDGKLLAVGGDKKASLLDVASGTVRGEPFKHEGNVWHVVFSPDGKLLATGNPGLVSVWDIASKKVIASLNEKYASGNWLNDVNFSSDGKMLALPRQHSVEVWDSALSKQLWTTTFEGFVRSSAFSPAGNVLAVASDENSVRLFDAASGTVLATLKGNRWGVMSLAYSHDGTRLVTGGGDGTVKIWDMTSFRELLTLGLTGHVSPIDSVAFSPDGRRLVAVGYGGVKMWLTATDAEVAAEAKASK